MSSLPCYRILRECLTRCCGLVWCPRSDHVLSRREKDCEVLRVLEEELGVRLGPEVVAHAFFTVMSKAGHLALVGEAEETNDSFEFLMLVREETLLGCHMNPLLFAELIRTLIQARERYWKRRRRIGLRAGPHYSPLAAAIDRFLRLAGPYYSDAELELRLNEELADEMEARVTLRTCGCRDHLGGRA